MNFRLAAVGTANQLKGNLYRFKPGRTVASPDYSNRGGEITQEDVSAPYTDPSVWQNRFVLCQLTFRKPDGEEMVMNDAVVQVSRKKNIVTTQIVGRDGTVKEYINMGDYDIKIVIGVQAEESGRFVDDYPEEGMRTLRNFLYLYD